MKQVIVKDIKQLPGESQEQFGIEKRLFEVIKSDGIAELLVMPPNGGGHTGASVVPAWWVANKFCEFPFQKGQRWQYKTHLVVECTADNIYDATVLQQKDCKIKELIEIKIGDPIKNYKQFIDVDSISNWERLDGQEKPQ